MHSFGYVRLESLLEPEIEHESFGPQANRKVAFLDHLSDGDRPRKAEVREPTRGESLPHYPLGTGNVLVDADGKKNLSGKLDDGGRGWNGRVRPGPATKPSADGGEMQAAERRSKLRTPCTRREAAIEAAAAGRMGGGGLQPLTDSAEVLLRG